jgi:hypothetical protein
VRDEQVENAPERVWDILVGRGVGDERLLHGEHVRPACLAGAQIWAANVVHIRRKLRAFAEEAKVTRKLADDL